MSADSSENAAEQLPAPVRRRRWLTVLLALLIFAAGLASGAAVTVAVAVHRLQYLIQHPEEAPGRIAARLGRRLRLDEGQKAKVEAIVAKRQAELMTLHGQIRPQVMEQLDLLRQEIGEVLTDPQRERWQRMFDELRETWLPPSNPNNALAEPVAHGSEAK
jgi:hypothetical protein